MKVLTATMLTSMFVQGTAELKNNVEQINALNVFPVPDGDTGTNMTLTMESAIKNIGGETCGEVSKIVSKGSLMGARGNSGVILSQIFRGLAKGMKDKVTLSVKDFAVALKEAKETAYSAVLKPVEGTILTVIKSIADKAVEVSKEELSFTDFFEVIIRQGEVTLSHTPELLPVLKQAGVVDAGGKGLIFFFHGMLDALNGKQVTVAEQKPMAAQMHFDTEDIRFTYCTEFIVGDVKGDASELMKTIEGLGDSMVFVQDEDLIKVHIHTDNPGVALQEALKYGSLVTTKIENMRLQHSEIIGNTIAKQESVSEVQNAPEYDARYGFIAVSSGEGFSSILKDLGVVGIIEGGQTMNPSTEDFMKEIEKCPSDYIFLFPNNSNIILSANQAKEISDKKVFVVPTKTIPQCIASLLAFDMEGEPEDNLAQAEKAITMIKTVSITNAVRDTQMSGLEIEKGNFIAVEGSRITATSPCIETTILEAVEKAGTHEFISVFYGEDVSPGDADSIIEKIRKACPESEVTLYSGGQAVYRYVISLE